VGHLVPVMGLAHLQRSGHRPIALVGGGTGMIGDPSGKNAERQLMSAEEIEANAKAIGKQLERFLDFSGPSAARMRDNAAWLRPLKAVEFMRDVGKHFTVNYMLAKDSVQSRIEGGISFTEFSYMLLQAYDFLELSRREGVTLQIGGSDQWGNITAGLELIRRSDGKTAHALTMPLVTTASGTKFGKTEAGAVWLDPERTSPYAFYQFWINTDDRDAVPYLKLFTFLERRRIEELEAALAEHPERREAQRALAREMTVLVHGEDEHRRAVELTEALFGGGELSRFDPERLEDALSSARSVEAKDGDTYAALLVGTELAKSNSDAQRLAASGSLSANDRPITDIFASPSAEDFLGGRLLVLRRGRRTHGLVIRR